MFNSPKNAHFVPAAKKVENFPFSCDLSVIPNEEVSNFIFMHKQDISIDFLEHEDIKSKIKEVLILIFPFHKYLDEYSEDYIGKDGATNDLILYIEVNQYKLVEVANKYKRKHIKTYVVAASNFKSDYVFNLVRSENQLREIFEANKDKKIIAFDTETEGLNPEIHKLVGISFSFEPKKGYYLPIAHDTEFSEFNLGISAVSIFYEELKRFMIAYLFNARFDMRVFEYTDKSFYMGIIKIMDVQVNCWFADPGYKKTSLKALEKHFLGYYRLDLQDTLKGSDIHTFNTALIHPEKILFYAAQDAISTFEIGEETLQYYKEFKISGQIDQALIYPLMDMENHPIRTNIVYAEKELKRLVVKLKELDEELAASIGNINLNSPQQKIALFKSFGLDTGTKTKTGAMSTGKDAVNDMIERMEDGGEEVPSWLRLLGDRSRLEKLYSTFFNSLVEQVRLGGNRIRINYRNTNTSTGRLSSGAEDD